MNVVLFCHSLVSDWNHGNAHFLRGIASELIARGHEVRVFEPRDAWSVNNLLIEAGPSAVEAFYRAFPHLTSERVDLASLDLDEALDGADVVIVHEWNDHDLVARIGQHRVRDRYLLFFHDTHHRSVSAPEQMRAYDLEHYDGVLAFGEVIRERYMAEGWSRRAWTWHEAADTRVFTPGFVSDAPEGDVVWIGNWGDDERREELRAYLIEPVRDLGLRARIHGVRYPDDALEMLADAGIDYAGWIANYRAPDVFARFRATVHVPRRPYIQALPGIPTIRVFEALACGIPLVSAWWEDAEHLFTPGEDYALARTPDEMRQALRDVLQDRDYARALASHGLNTIRARHTCTHRVDELMSIVQDLRGARAREAVTV